MLCLLPCSWMVPASSPAPSFGGSSLLSVFNEQIGKELAHFPTGPAIDSPFWLYFTVFHVGLFVCM
jgi:photosystem I subunit PsaO